MSEIKGHNGLVIEREYFACCCMWHNHNVVVEWAKDEGDEEFRGVDFYIGLNGGLPLWKRIAVAIRYVLRMDTVAKIDTEGVLLHRGEFERLQTVLAKAHVAVWGSEYIYHPPQPPTQKDE